MIYLTLFLTFFKIGAFTFGGGYAMLPLVQEAVLEKGWMTMENLVDFIAISESTPGPFAVNVSTYVGMHTGGLLGALCATIGVVLPSFIIILIVARIFVQFKNNKVVQALLSGLKPAVIGLIASSVISVGGNVLGASDMPVIPLCIFGLMILLSIKKVHPIIMIALSSLLGILVHII